MNLDYGLPSLPHLDEWRVVEDASRMAYSESPDLHPSFFNYPALQLYVLAASLRVVGLGSTAREERDDAVASRPPTCASRGLSRPASPSSP